MVNGETSQRFVFNAIRIVEIFAVFVASLGMFELFIVHHLSGASIGDYVPFMNLEIYRISSTLGNPVILSTYLTLGFPFLLCELAYAERKPLRDFWMVSTAVVFINILLTQTRIGLISLAITIAVFCYRYSKDKFYTFLISFSLLFLVLMAVGSERYSPRYVFLEWRQAIIRSGEFLATMSSEHLLIGVGANNTNKSKIKEFSIKQDPTDGNKTLLSNMHLLLIIENGIIGWLIMMWILFAALKTFYTSYTKIQDEKLRMILWAIFSSTIGFIVSMNNMASFSKISLQVLFWGLLGLGVAIAVRFSTRKAGFIKVWEFEE
jgi:hypothetical protein